jgi:hypothetical protein
MGDSADNNKQDGKQSKDVNPQPPGLGGRVANVAHKIGKVLDWVNPVDNLGQMLQDHGERKQENAQTRGGRFIGKVERVLGGAIEVASDSAEGMLGKSNTYTKDLDPQGMLISKVAGPGPHNAIRSGINRISSEINDAIRDPDGAIRTLDQKGIGGGKDALETEYAAYADVAQNRPEQSAGKKFVNAIVNTVAGTDVTSPNDAHRFEKMKLNGGSMEEYNDLAKAAKKGDGSINIDEYGQFRQTIAPLANQPEGEKHIKGHVEYLKGALSEGADAGTYVDKMRGKNSTQALQEYRTELREEKHEAEKEKKAEKGGKKVAEAGVEGQEGHVANAAQGLRNSQVQDSGVSASSNSDPAALVAQGGQPAAKGGQSAPARGNALV